MRIVLIVLVLYAGLYLGVRSMYMTTDAEGAVVRYPPGMFPAYALFWPAAEVDRWLTGVPSRMQQQRDIRDVMQ
jgi:hypothetical protein